MAPAHAGRATAAEAGTHAEQTRLPNRLPSARHSGTDFLAGRLAELALTRESEDGELP